MHEFRAENLSVRYGNRGILDAVGFVARAGEVTVIAGPNGSGKSTLVKALSGELPYAGSVAMNGHDIRALKPWQLAAMRAVLPQETTVAFPFTAGEIVRLGLTAGEFADAPEAAHMVDAALEKVGLAGFSGRRYQMLSGGERQRVQLARVLCQIWEPVGPAGPRWLVMDEPVASLDIRHQLSLMELASEFAAAGGGVIAVMHDLNLTAMYADSMVLMKGGVVHDAGKPQDVLSAQTLQAVFDCTLHPNAVPHAGTFILPQSAARASVRLSHAAE